MDIDSEDDIFNEEEEVDEDVWGIVWDAEIEEDDFDGDLFDNGDVDQSSIDESEEMSAGVLEDQLREKVAMIHEQHNAVVTVLHEDELPHNDHGSPYYTPLDLSKCGIALLSSSKRHHQTCDSCCFGPCNGDAEYISVINERGNEPTVHMGVQGRGRQAPCIPAVDQTLTLRHLRVFGSTPRINACYSCRWSNDNAYMGITTALSRVSFWLNRMGASEKSDPVATKTTSNALPGANLQPCGSIQVPQLDHLAEAQGLTVRAVQEKCRLMINCIRFGSVAGKQRAIVAGQNGAIYVFELPPPPSPSQDPPAGDQFLCHSLRPAAAQGRYGQHTELITDLLNSGLRNLMDEPLRMPVLLEDTLLRLMPEICEAHNVAQVAIRPVVQECLKETQVLARFHGAVNCASPSPCGRWVAVLTDSMTVTVLPEALDYKTRCGMLLRWPDVGRQSRRAACIGCQYVAWSPDGQYLAVSSDSHKAVSVWKLSLKTDTVLDPEELGKVLHDAIVEAACPQASASADVRVSASDLAVYLPESHSRFLTQLRGAGNADRGMARAGRGGRGNGASSILQSEMCLEGGDAGRSVTYGARNVRERVLRVLGAALWGQINVHHVCSYVAHGDPCLALAFVPGTPAMLCWAEELGRVHFCDVRQPLARQCVHLSTLPMQMAFALDGASCMPASAADNWGIPVEQNGRDCIKDSADAVAEDDDSGCVSLQLQPPPTVDIPLNGEGLGSHRTHASSIMDAVWDVWREAGHAAMPVALVLGLARGECLKVPKELAEAGREIQQRYKSIRDAELSTSPEDKLMERVGRGPWLEQNILEQNLLDQNIITGITAAGDHTVMVSTMSHVFRLEVNTTWEAGVAWPLAFRKAVQELLKVHKRQSVRSRVKDAAMCLGDMPPDVMRLIISKAAGERIDWMDDEGHVSGVRDVAEFCGLTRKQCFSDFFLNAVHVPPRLVSGLLCP